MTRSISPRITSFTRGEPSPVQALFSGEEAGDARAADLQHHARGLEALGDHLALVAALLGPAQVEVHQLAHPGARRLAFAGGGDVDEDLVEVSARAGGHAGL